jgi:hypothetical protein
MKTLELIVYPQDERWTEFHKIPTYVVPGLGTVWPDLWTTKRLTDAEAAAEHLQATLDVYRAKVFRDEAMKDRALDRMQTTLRFATLPHFDEAVEL